jgi:hypothetical protein
LGHEPAKLGIGDQVGRSHDSGLLRGVRGSRLPERTIEEQLRSAETHPMVGQPLHASRLPVPDDHRTLSIETG